MEVHLLARWVVATDSMPFAPCGHMPLVRNTNRKPQLHEFNNVSPQRVALTNGFDFQYAVSYYRFTAGGNIFAKK